MGTELWRRYITASTLGASVLETMSEMIPSLLLSACMLLDAPPSQQGSRAHHVGTEAVAKADFS